MKDIISDKSGKETLEVVGEAQRFNLWMFQTIEPFCKGRILEIGSGLGNISTFFLERGFEIMLTDLRPEYCSSLRKDFQHRINLLGVEQIDLVHTDFEVKYKQHLGQYDTVFALNVIEHIRNDDQAISNCKKLLSDNGHLIILVPSYNKLYNKFDEELGHFRRYTIASLSHLFHENRFTILNKKYFNFMGILGWFFSGSILKKSTIPGGQMKLYDRLVPVWKMLDKLAQNKIGLSTIIVGRKNANQEISTNHAL